MRTMGRIVLAVVCFAIPLALLGGGGWGAIAGLICAGAVWGGTRRKKGQTGLDMRKMAEAGGERGRREGSGDWWLAAGGIGVLIGLLAIGMLSTAEKEGSAKATQSKTTQSKTDTPRGESRVAIEERRLWLPAAREWKGAEIQMGEAAWTHDGDHPISRGLAKSTGSAHSGVSPIEGLGVSAKLAVWCSSKTSGAVRVSLNLRFPEGSTGPRQPWRYGQAASVSARWSGAEGQATEYRAMLYASRIHVGEQSKAVVEAFLDRLEAEHELRLALPGKEGERLLWGTSLRGSARAIQRERAECRERPRQKPRTTTAKTGGADRVSRGAGCPGDGDVHGAWAYTQLHVRQRLRAPRSADFPFGGYRALRKTGPCTWSGSSWVDATNAFGAEVRTHFHVQIRRVRGGWALDSLSLQ